MGLMKKLTAALVASSLVVSLVATASAAYTPASGDEAGKRMQELKLITGRAPNNDLALNSEITRAELVTIIVRAFGKEEDAKLLKGSTIFPDIQNHWASGNIAMAVALVEKAGGGSVGMPDGTFAPDAKLTPAQAVAFLMKFLGQGAAAGKTWPNNYLDPAVEKGLITAEDKALIAPMLNENAVRGLVFYMFDRAFYNYKLADGATFYTKYVDTMKPTLTVTAPAATTIDSKVTVSGTVKDAIAVYVGSEKVTVTNGAFTYDVNLPELKEYPITVTAMDLAGNKAENSFKVTRTVGTAKKIDAAAAITLGAGEAKDFAVKVLDANGNEIKDAVVTATGDIATFAAGKLTAGDKTGTGAVTLKSGDLTATVNVTVTAGALASLELATDPATTNVAVGTPLKLVATGKDAKGNVVDIAGKVSYTATNGIVDGAGNFAATVAGTSKVTATVGTISKDLSITVYSSASKLAISNTKSIVRNGESKDTLTVTAVDANGFVAANYNEDVVLTIIGLPDHLDIYNGTTNQNNTYTVKAVNGVATFTVKSQQPATSDGTARVQATSGSLTGALKEISLVKPVLAEFKASADVSQVEAHIAAGAKITVKAYDQEGVNVGASAAYTLTWTSSNTDSVPIVGASNNSFDVAFSAGESEDFLNVRATAIPGVATLSATVKDANGVVVAVPINTVAITTSFGYAAAKVQLIGAEDIKLTATTTTAKTFKVALLDQVGNVLGSQSGTFSPVISIKDKDGVDASAKFTLDETATPVNGVKSITIVPSNANNNAGTYTIEASSGNLTKTSGMVTVTPAAANKVVFTSDNDEVAADGISNVVLTAKVVDARSNQVSYNGALTLKMYQPDLDPTAAENFDTVVHFTMPANATVNAVEGKATWTLKSKTVAGGQDDFKVEGDLAGTGTATTLTMVKADNSALAALELDTALTGAATKLEVLAAYGANNTGAATKAAGEAYEIKVLVKDAQNPAKTVTSDNGRPVTLVIKSGTGTIENATVNTVNGVATFKLSSTKGGTSGTAPTSNVVVYAEAGGLTTSGDATAYFKSGAASKIVMSPNAADMQVGSSTTVTVKYVDSFGNFVAGNPNIKNLAVSNSAGTVASTTNNTGSFVLSAATVPASGAVSAADAAATGAVTVDGFNLNVYNAGLMYRAQIADIAAVAADVSSGQITAKVTLVDYNGLRLTALEDSVAKVPFKLKVTLPDGTTTYTFDGLGNPARVADSFVDGVATFKYTMPASNNAGQYKFEVVAMTSAELVANGYHAVNDAQMISLATAVKTSSTFVTVNPAKAASVEIFAINPTDGTDVNTTWEFTGAVAFIKVAALDAKSNVATTFNGTAKVVLTGATNLKLVGANTSGELNVTLTNGYGTAQIQRDAAGAISLGTLTTTLTIDGADDTEVLTIADLP